VLSNQTIEELRTILREDFHQEVTQQEAHGIAHVFVDYFDLLAAVNHPKDHD